MQKEWIQKSICNGYIIRVYTIEDGEVAYEDHTFTNMWDAINFFNE